VLDFRNCLLVEQPNGDFARTMVRQLLFSTWQHMLYQRLADSSDQAIREVAAKAVKEVAYHREIAAEWVIRLGDGTEKAAPHPRRARLVLALRARVVRGRRGAGSAIAAASPPTRAASRLNIAPPSRRADRATLPVPADQRAILGGRRGHHSEHLGHLLAIMQYLPAHLPGCDSGERKAFP
jgi:ring-1,2-phenylacetyl-CoA epoxidase subunit PaaC